MHNSNLTLVLALGLLTAACSGSDERSYIDLTLQLGTGVPIPASIHLSVKSGAPATEVKTGDKDWPSTTSRTMQIGLFIPSGIAGPVDITAQAMLGGVPVGEGSLPSIALKVGGKVGPYTIVLDTPVSPPVGADGGSDSGTVEVGGPDSAAPDLGADAGASVAPDPGADAGAPETGLPDVGGSDTIHLPDVPAVEVDTADLRLVSDAADANSIEPDGPTNQVDTSDAGHVRVWEPGQNIEKDIINSSYYPVVAVEPIAENVYVAWTESTAIKVKRWNKSTGAWEKTITVDSRGGPQSAVIGADAKGNIILVWCQNTQGADTTLDGVWASRTADGLAWSSPVRFASTGAWGTQLAVSRNGVAHVAYSKQGSSSWPLYTAYYDGTSWTENPTPLDPNADYTDSLPRVVLSATGDGIIVFNQGYDIAATSLTGASFTTPTVLAPADSSASIGDWGVAMNRKGEGVLLWSEYTSNNNMPLLAKTYNPTVGWSSTLPPILSSYAVYSIAVAMDEQDNLTVVWQQTLAAGGMNMVGMHGSLTGTWTDVTPLETDNVASYRVTEYAFPKLAVDASGSVLAVWRKAVSLSAPTTYGAYASRFAGGNWLPQFQLGQKTGLDIPEVNLSVADSGFGAASFYYRTDSTTTDPDAYNAEVAFFR